jgi:hypothetical protein
MNMSVAFALGYALGAKSGGKELDQLGRSIKALLESDEVADILAAGRAHVGMTLRELASMVDGEKEAPDVGGDLVSRVKSMVRHS